MVGFAFSMGQVAPGSGHWAAATAAVVVVSVAAVWLTTGVKMGLLLLSCGDWPAAAPIGAYKLLVLVKRENGISVEDDNDGVVNTEDEEDNDDDDGGYGEIDGQGG